GKAFVEENFRFNQFLTGQKEIAPRWKRCVQMTDATLGEAVGRTFVKTTIGDQGKGIAKQMIQGIEKAFDENLARVSWMDDATRKVSAEKLHKLDNKVGYPDRWREYDSMKIDRTRREWWTPQVADAYKERAACVANQYDQYVATDEVHVNGKLTLGENIADIGGLKLALAALRANGQARPGSSRFTPEQQLFLS